jgi:hypothetical protein
MKLLPGWDSAQAAEEIHDWLEYFEIVSLFFAVVFDFAAWKWTNLETARQLTLMGNISLGCLVVLECFGWPYGRRAKELRKIEATEQERIAEGTRKTVAVLDFRRTFSEVQREIFKATISPRAVYFQVLTIAGDSECKQYAAEFFGVLEFCGWKGAGQYPIALDWRERDPQGISVTMRNDDPQGTKELTPQTIELMEAISELKRAIFKASIVEKNAPPESRHYLSPSFVTIIVGRKLPQ